VQRTVHVLVVTVVHTPFDARMFHREIGALRAAGHTVTYVAPFSGYGVERPADTPGLAFVDVPRASGRDRLRALRAARRIVRERAADVDLVLVPDPELPVALLGLRRPPTVYDVHEDTPTTLIDKQWVPGPARRPLKAVVAGVERLLERRTNLVLADAGYEKNFAQPHPVVPNDTVVPDVVAPPGDDRVVYLGRVSRGRGADVLLALPPLLPAGVRLDVIGPADRDVEPQLAAAATRGELDWAGFVPNDEAHRRLEGALAGVMLVHDLPNYRTSRQTKVVEYMAHGVPVVSTPTDTAVEIVGAHDSGILVSFGDVQAVADAIRRLHDDPGLREKYAANGHRAALEHYDWRRSGPEFVATLERFAAPPG
jgi:glycosyltransferase involved in cell wall biosynthesis